MADNMTNPLNVIRLLPFYISLGGCLKDVELPHRKWQGFIVSI